MNEILCLIRQLDRGILNDTLALLRTWSNTGQIMAEVFDRLIVMADAKPEEANPSSYRATSGTLSHFKCKECGWRVEAERCPTRCKQCGSRRVGYCIGGGL